MPPNASQGISDAVTGGRVGGPVDARLARRVGDAKTAVACRLAAGDGVNADTAAGVVCVGGGRTGLAAVAGWVATIAAGVGGLHTVWNAMIAGLCPAPAA